MSLLNNIASVYIEKKKYLDAYENYKKADELISEARNSDPELISEIYNGMGICLKKMNEYANAIKYFNKSLEIFGKYCTSKNTKNYQDGNYNRNKKLVFIHVQMISTYYLMKKYNDGGLCWRGVMLMLVSAEGK